MSDIQRIPDMNFKPSPAMINILIALADGEKHGFAITLRIEDFTNGEVKIGPGTLFGSLKRLLDAGMLEQSSERIDPDLDDQRRRYYRLTGLGQRSVQQEIQRQSSRGNLNPIKDLLGSSIMGGG
jgi:DNA-binding PadR family transcriptional regulator